MSSHGFSVAQRIAPGGVLGILPPVLLVFGVEAGSVAPATEPSPAVRAAVAGLCDAIAGELGRITQ